MKQLGRVKVLRYLDDSMILAGFGWPGWLEQMTMRETLSAPCLSILNQQKQTPLDLVSAGRRIGCDFLFSPELSRTMQQRITYIQDAGTFYH